ENYDAVVKAINAGLDMIMVPFEYKAFIIDLTKAVENGDVTEARIDDAVSRILYAKFALGLFDSATTHESYLADFGSEAHRAIAREAVQKSLVLLKHENDALPLQKSQKITVVGQAADDIGLACGGWTIEWQGGTGAITEGSTLLDGIRSQVGENVAHSASGELAERVDTAVVVIAEPPYAEGEGDEEDLNLTSQQLDLIRQARASAGRVVLVIYSGRPLILGEALDLCDAIVAAWLPGSEAAAIADVLFGSVPFTGKTPFTWFTSMGQLPLSHLQRSGQQPLYSRGHGIQL
ncbi:MAG: glycoside hydrolase family 3 protein, partial [Chloroflexota bacterium]